MKVIATESGFVLAFKSVKEARGVAEQLKGFAEGIEERGDKPPHLYSMFIPGGSSVEQWKQYLDDLKGGYYIAPTNRKVDQGEEVQRCRVCRCTDDDCRGCVERTGEPCHWVEKDLCSACVKPPTEKEKFLCPLCPEMFDTAEEFDNHMTKERWAE